MPGKKILLAFGTRPEAVKLCPLIKRLQDRPGMETRVCVTGQHRQMLDPVLRAFAVTPDWDLDVMRPEQSLNELTRAVLSGMERVLARTRPDVLVVQGDTTTAFAAALAAFYARIPVAHVEAGLRTGDMTRPWPEELNRRAVSLMSRLHFAPTEMAAANLFRDGISPEDVFVTGNTAIDALRTTVRADYTHPQLDWAADSRLVLVTAHRRENLGAPMARMLRAIRRVVDEHADVKVLFPVHMNPEVRRTVRAELGGHPRIRLIEPLGVVDFHNFMARSTLILTDSGGVQEEAPSLGKPVLVMRDVTERPEGVQAGTLLLVGTDGDVIYRRFTRLLDDPAAYAAMARAVNPYGDGRACERIADILEKL